MTWTMTFEDAGATLDAVGGKAVNLCRLARAGFPVPPGFVVTTDAFRAVVADPQLNRAIHDALAGVGPADVAPVDVPVEVAGQMAVDAASAAIRAAFAATEVPALLRSAVLDAYARL